MPKKSDKERVKTWQTRVDGSTKVFDQWEERYKTKKLYDYYLGHQWEEGAGADNYVINLIFSTIETQLPAQLFYHPRYVVKARPSQSDDVASTANDRANLQQDTLNSFVVDPKLKFKSTIEPALLESYFRYGVIEVGYTADFNENPNAGKPMLQETGEDMADEKGPVLQPAGTMNAENLYLKYIPANTFRTSLRASPILSQNDWYGYYEWVYPEDLRADKRLKNTSQLTPTGKIKDAYLGEVPTSENADARKDMLKLWKIWDIRGKGRIWFVDGGEKFLLEEPADKFPDGSTVCPHAILMKHSRLGEFLPLPPVYNWISPQDELNEARNMQKVYRRKLIPKFGANPNVEPKEIEKFLENVIQVISLQNKDSIWAIDMPTADAGLMRALPNTREDMNEITGTGSEQKGISTADTATQANIINMNSQVRESRARVQVADWMAEIGRLMLYFLRTKMALPFWIARNTDAFGENVAVEALKTAQTWEQITGSKLGESGDVTVDADSISPQTEAGERQDWLTALSVIAQNPVIMLDDTIMRKTLGYFGVREDKVLQSLKRLGMMIMAAQAAQQQQEAATKGQGGKAAPGPTPDNSGIQAQLQQQMGTA